MKAAPAAAAQARMQQRPWSLPFLSPEPPVREPSIEHSTVVMPPEEVACKATEVARKPCRMKARSVTALSAARLNADLPSCLSIPRLTGTRFRRISSFKIMFFQASESLVGVRGFEPPAPSSRTRCATRLRYTPRAAGLSRPLLLSSAVIPAAGQPDKPQKWRNGA